MGIVVPLLPRLVELLELILQAQDQQVAGAQPQGGRFGSIRQSVAVAHRPVRLALVANLQIEFQDPVLAAQIPGLRHSAAGCRPDAGIGCLERGARSGAQANRCCAQAQRRQQAASSAQHRLTRSGAVLRGPFPDCHGVVRSVYLPVRGRRAVDRIAWLARWVLRGQGRYRSRRGGGRDDKRICGVLHSSRRWCESVDLRTRSAAMPGSDSH